MKVPDMEHVDAKDVLLGNLFGGYVTDIVLALVSSCRIHAFSVT